MIPRVRSRLYLDFIRQLPCIVCGDGTTVEACHVRFADVRAAKQITGIGIKSGDDWALPLCGRHHREQHNSNERTFWKEHGIDAIFECLALYRICGDYDAAMQIIGAARQ